MAVILPQSSGALLTGRVLSYWDAQGIPLHGANRLDTYVSEIIAAAGGSGGLVDARSVPMVEKCMGATAVVHGLLSAPLQPRADGSADRINNNLHQ